LTPLLFFPKEIKTVVSAKRIIVSLSRPGKMPCHGYSLPAELCKTGSKLRDVEGSTCSGCYAMKGWFLKKHVRIPLMKRLEAIRHPQWIEAMIFLIKHYNEGYFRWHDSGDIQDLDHLSNIIKVVQATPETKHWLPTSEWNIIRDFWNLMKRRNLSIMFPNLTIRLSATMIDGETPRDLAKLMGVQVSCVSKFAWDCPAQDNTYVENNGRKLIRAGNCGNCRRCWNQENLEIAYPLH